GVCRPELSSRSRYRSGTYGIGQGGREGGYGSHRSAGRGAMDLYLVRHAVAFEHGDPAYPDDDERPLTEKGRRQCRKAAAGFLELVDAPALILTSPLPRATQTAELLQAEAGGGT